MPNILICGYGKKAVSMKDKIDKALREINFDGESITFILDGVAESCSGDFKDMPYLWIRSTEKADIHSIVSIFAKHGICEDIEWDIIGGFIPAEKISDVCKTKKHRHENCPEYGSIDYMISGICPSCGKP